MRRVHGYYTDCPVCGREVEVDRVGDENVVRQHELNLGVPPHPQCPGGKVPDSAVTVVRLEHRGQ